MTESTNNQDLEAVLRRVQKLLAIANDSRANPNEAAAAASQAERIMRKYQVDHADVIAAQLKTEDAFDQVDVGGTMDPDAYARSTTTWAGMLGLAVAKLNDCKATWERSERLGVCLRFSGYKSDVQVAQWTYLYIVNQMANSLREHQARTGAGRKQSEDYRKGFVVAVCGNIGKEIERKKQEMATTSSSRALVLAKSQAVVERFGKQPERRNRFSSGADYHTGHAHGQRVDLGRRAMGGSTGGTILLG